MKKTGNAFVHFLSACRNSAAGVVSVFRHETAFRQEVLLAVPHFILLYGLGFSASVWLFLTALLGGVLALELVNSAVESVVDLVSPGYHELAKRAKDAASAAVGVALAVYGGAWAVLLIQRIGR